MNQHFCSPVICMFYLHINSENFIILGLVIQAQNPQCIIGIQKTPEKYVFSKWEWSSCLKDEFLFLSSRSVNWQELWRPGQSTPTSHTSGLQGKANYQEWARAS